MKAAMKRCLRSGASVKSSLTFTAVFAKSLQVSLPVGSMLR